MLFSKIVERVIINTKRPDCGFVSDGGDDRIPQQVWSSLEKFHTIDFFQRDIITAQVYFDSSAYIQSLDTSALPRFRKMAEFRKWDPNYNSYQTDPTVMPPLYDGLSQIGVNSALSPIDIITVDNLFDNFGAEKSNVAYQAGVNFVIRSNTAFQYGNCAWYQFPFLGTVERNYEDCRSWVADLYGDAIVWDATSSLFSQTGKQDEARKLDAPDQNGISGGEAWRRLRSFINDQIALEGGR